MPELTFRHVVEGDKIAKRWITRSTLITGLLGLPVMPGCTDKQQPQIETKIPTALPESSIWIEPYGGEIAYDEDGTPYQKSRLIVKVKGGVSPDKVAEIAGTIGGKVSACASEFNIFGIDVTGSLDEAIELLAKVTDVEIAGKNYCVLKSNAWDNDLYQKGDTGYSDLWWSREIKLSEGLDVFQDYNSKNPITIAVIERSGFDLKNGDVPYIGNEKIDGAELFDSFPFVPKTYHWDFGDMDSDVTDNLPANDVYKNHGTNVALFAAAINNGIRTNGVAATKEFKILPLKYGQDNPIVEAGDLLSVLLALGYLSSIADKTDVKVVNMSFGTSLDPIRMALSKALFDPIVSSFNKRGIILVAAAGNYVSEALPGDHDPDACNNVPSVFEGVIAAGGTMAQFNLDSPDKVGEVVKERRDTGSKYSLNSKCLTISAPSSNILVYQDGKPSWTEGTSFAAAQVSGLVALIKSVKPDATLDEVVALLGGNNANFIVLDDDPDPSATGRILKRINVENTLRAILPVKSGLVCNTIASGVLAMRELAGRIAYSTPDGAQYIFDSSTATTTKVENRCTAYGVLVGNGGMICASEGAISANSVTSLETVTGKSYPPPSILKDKCSANTTANGGSAMLWDETFVFNCLDTQVSLYVSNLASGEMTLVAGMPTAGSFSLYGNGLAYTDKNDGKMKLYDISTSQTYDTGYGSYYPMISGTHILFSNIKPATEALTLIDMSEPTQPKATEIAVVSNNPGFYSPNLYTISGNLVAYQSIEGNTVIYNITSKEAKTLYLPQGSTPPLSVDDVQVDGKDYIMQTDGKNIFLLAQDGTLSSCKI